MFKAISDYFNQNIHSVSGGVGAHPPEKALQLATASLLLEISRADFHMSGEERAVIANQIQRCFKLTHQETDELVSLAESEVEDATCLFEFTRLVNEHFDYQDKCRVVEMMWRVAYADADKDKYEEHLVRRIADLIHVSHNDFVRLRVQVAAG